MDKNTFDFLFYGDTIFGFTFFNLKDGVNAFTTFNKDIAKSLLFSGKYDVMRVSCEISVCPNSIDDFIINKENKNED